MHFRYIANSCSDQILVQSKFLFRANSCSEQILVQIMDNESFCLPMECAVGELISGLTDQTTQDNGSHGNCINKQQYTITGPVDWTGGQDIL